MSAWVTVARCSLAFIRVTSIESRLYETSGHITFRRSREKGCLLFRLPRRRKSGHQGRAGEHPGVLVVEQVKPVVGRPAPLGGGDPGVEVEVGPADRLGLVGQRQEATSDSALAPAVAFWRASAGRICVAASASPSHAA